MFKVKSQAGPDWLFDKVIEQKRKHAAADEGWKWLLGRENRRTCVKSFLLLVVCLLIVCIPIMWDTAEMKKFKGRHKAVMIEYDGVVYGGVRALYLGTLDVPVSEGRANGTCDCFIF